MMDEHPNQDSQLAMKARATDSAVVSEIGATSGQRVKVSTPVKGTINREKVVEIRRCQDEYGEDGDPAVARNAKILPCDGAPWSVGAVHILLLSDVHLS